MKRTRLFTNCSIILCIAFAAMLLSVGSSPLRCQIAMRKMWNCFVGWPGCLTALALMIVLAVIARPAGREAVGKLSPPTIIILVLAMLVVDYWAGVMQFRTHGFYHSMWRWGTYRYIQTAGDNMLWSFPLTAGVILVTRPWRFVAKAGLLRVLSGAWALFILNYFIAFVAYVLFQSYEVE